MAIEIDGTKQLNELPPLAISGTDNFAHEVGSILGRATIDELVAYLRSTLSAVQYEIKYIRAPNNDYITANFDMTVGANQGLGLTGGLWSGWAICNGNNGTDNLDGRALIGYGAIYNTVGQMVGFADATLVAHSHYMVHNNSNTDGNARSLYDGTDANRFNYALSARGVNLDADAYDYELASFPGTANAGKTSSNGSDGTNKNIPPSMVILAIMKL